MGVTRVVAAVLMVVALACSEPVGVESDILIVEITNARLRLTNRITEPVYYFAVDNETAAVIDWAPCTDPEQCKSVAARSATVVPLAGLTVQKGAANLVVFHWRLVTRAGQAGYVVDSVRTVTVELP